MDKINSTTQVGHLTVSMESDVDNGEVLDTKVEVEGSLLCYVAGNQRDKFIQKLQGLVDEYRI